MTSEGLSNAVEPGLLGIEIGRNKVRLALVDARSGQLVGVAERPIAKAGGPRDPIEEEVSTRAAIEAGFDRLGIAEPGVVSVAVTIGFANCGVGSGPALYDWLESLSEEIDEPVVYNGDPGISYAPARCVDFARRVFDPIGLRLIRVELAPVAAARVLGSVRSGAIQLGSGVAWSARLLNSQVLEAFEAGDGGFDEALQLVANGTGQTIDELDEAMIDQGLCRDQGVEPAALAPALGAALGLTGSDASNLLDAASVGDEVEEHLGDSDPFPAGYGARETSAGVPVAPRSGARATVRASTRSGMAETGARAIDTMETVPEPPPVAEYVDEDLGTIQDELRAHHRSVDDTHRLRRIPRSVEHSRELRTTPPPVGGRSRSDFGQSIDDEFTGIEDFAHPDAAIGAGEGFHVSDFLLGALGMLAIVLIAALILL